VERETGSIIYLTDKINEYRQKYFQHIQNVSRSYTDSTALKTTGKKEMRLSVKIMGRSSNRPIGLTVSVFASCPITCHAGAKGERKYSSYSFLTSELDRGEWSTSRPGRALPPGKEPQYLLGRRWGGPLSWLGHGG
jgi:hypothetical protein